MITKNEDATVEETERTRGDETLHYMLCRDITDGRDSYSIRALSYKSGVKVCQATACDVSSVYERAKEMYDAVANGFVEPYVLCDVIYDLLP